MSGCIGHGYKQFEYSAMEVAICQRLQSDYSQNPEFANDVVRDIEVLGFPRREVRSLEEPTSFDVTGVMSFPRLDFEVDLGRELNRIGATKAETTRYVEGLRRGGALVSRPVRTRRPTPPPIS